MMSSKQATPPSCKPCCDEGNHIEAEGYCETCDEYLCRKCFTVHNIPSPCKHHVLLDKTSMPIRSANGNSATKLSLCTMICPGHEGSKVMEFYCSTHNTVQCGVCNLKKHKSCDVKYIPELKEVDNYKDSTEYKATVTKLQTLQSDTRKLIEDVKGSMNRTEEKINGKMEDIEAFRNDLIRNVDKQVDLLRKQGARRKKENTSLKRKLIADITSLQDKIAQSEHKIVSLQSGRSDLFTASKKAREQAPEFDKTLQKYQAKNREEEYTFKRNETLQCFLSSNGELGTLDQSYQSRKSPLPSVANTTQTSVPNMTQTSVANTKPTSVPNMTSTLITNMAQPSVANISSTSEINMSTSSVGNLTSTAVANMVSTSVVNTAQTSIANMSPTVYFTSALLTKLQDVNMKTKEDKGTPAIYGLVYLPPNRLLATDWCNCKIKFIDTTNNTIISHLPLSSNPHSVTLLPGNQVAAVTMPHENSVQLISTSGRLSCFRSIPVEGQCCGICSTNSSIIVSFSQPASVQVMDLTGKVLITIDTDISGKQLFENPNNVSVAEESGEQMIFVSDVSTNTITKLSMLGRVVSTYKWNTWNRIYGLEAVGGKQVLVCNYVGHTVDVIEEDEENKVTLLDKRHGIAFPRALCYCPAQGRLYVASNLEGNPVWAFDIKHKI